MVDQWNDGSIKHHYIPEYYTKGWTDTEGLLYVYDKRSNRFLGRRLSPAGLFYEREGNTVQPNGRRNTIAEKAFTLVDTRYAPILERIRAEGASVMGMNEVSATMLTLAVNQHFRVPANDGLYRQVYDQTGMVVGDEAGSRNAEKEAQLKADETNRKASRAFLPFSLLMATLKEHLHEPLYLETAILGKGYPLFVLSDNPVVYPVRLTRAAELVKSFMFPVDCCKMYARHSTPATGKELLVSGGYNVLSIDQAIRWVCAPNETLLRAAVDYWLKVHNAGHLPALREALFRNCFHPASQAENSVASPAD